MSKLFYISENYVPKGQIEGYPLEVVDRMIHEQVKQGNKPDVTLFEESIYKGAEEGGFTWEDTGEGGIWRDCIDDNNFLYFQLKYKGVHITQEEYYKVNKFDSTKKHDGHCHLRCRQNRLQTNRTLITTNKPKQIEKDIHEFNKLVLFGPNSKIVD